LHELSITREILNIILDTAGRNNARSVESVNIELGQLSTFDEESISFYFEFLSKGTLAEGAKLIFKRMPAIAKCKKCGGDFEPAMPMVDSPNDFGEGMRAEGQQWAAVVPDGA